MLICFISLYFNNNQKEEKKNIRFINYDNFIWLVNDCKQIRKNSRKNEILFQIIIISKI